MTEENADAGIDLIEMTTRVVSAYVSHNALSADDLPRLITCVACNRSARRRNRKQSSFPLSRSGNR